MNVLVLIMEVLLQYVGVLLLFVTLPTPVLFLSTGAKEIERFITGTKDVGGTGSFTAPFTYPGAGYARDATSYIFVMENVAIDGSVELSVDHFDIHPDSWFTIRNSKYGGHIGQVLGRFSQENLPPRVIRTDTCCLRLEFQTGCCETGSEGFTGFKASYKFITTPGKGRRAQCTDKVYSQLCNGECIPEVWECPCPQYGQYKCENGMCIASEAVCDGTEDCLDGSDEQLCVYGKSSGPLEGLGPMFTFAVVITTICSILGGVCILFFILSIVDKIRKRKLKKKLKSSSCNGAVVGKEHTARVLYCPKHGAIVVPGPKSDHRTKSTVPKSSSQTKPVSVTVSPVNSKENRAPVQSRNTAELSSSTYRAFASVDDPIQSRMSDPPPAYPHGSSHSGTEAGRHCIPRRPISENLNAPWIRRPIPVKPGSSSAPNSPLNPVKLQRVSPLRAGILQSDASVPIQKPVPVRQAKRIADASRTSSRGSDAGSMRNEDPWVKGPEPKPVTNVSEILAMETNVDGYIAGTS